MKRLSLGLVRENNIYKKTFQHQFKQLLVHSYQKEVVIIDIATGETIVPFGPHTSMSCDSTSNYFVQWLSGFYPERAYKIIYKLKYDDGQEQIFDNDFEFIVKR